MHWAGMPWPNWVMSLGYPGCITVSLNTQNCFPAHQIREEGDKLEGGHLMAGITLQELQYTQEKGRFSKDRHGPCNKWQAITCCLVLQHLMLMCRSFKIDRTQMQWQVLLALAQRYWTVHCCYTELVNTQLRQKKTTTKKTAATSSLSFFAARNWVKFVRKYSRSCRFFNLCLFLCSPAPPSFLSKPFSLASCAAIRLRSTFLTLHDPRKHSSSSLVGVRADWEEAGEGGVVRKNDKNEVGWRSRTKRKNKGYQIFCPVTLLTHVTHSVLLLLFD